MEKSQLVDLMTFRTYLDESSTPAVFATRVCELADVFRICGEAGNDAVQRKLHELHNRKEK